MPRKGEKISAEQLAKRIGRKHTEASKQKMRKPRVRRGGFKKWTEEQKQAVRREHEQTSPINKRSLAALHIRVNQQRGKPKFCEKCGTEDAKLYDWASPDHRRESYEDVHSYIRMCRKCHNVFDYEAAQVLYEARKEIEGLRAEIEQLKRGE